MQISLNGTWDWGLNRTYTNQATVPGLVTDPTVFTDAPLWYRRRIALPEGDWEACTLTLNGARFRPAVYVNGDKVSCAAGGMTVTEHRLNHPDVLPGAVITLEVKLQPLDCVPVEDASRPSKADWWRTNLSSLLWDSVTLRVHGKGRIERVVPSANLEDDAIDLRWNVDCPQFAGYVLKVELLAADASLLFESNFPVCDDHGIYHVSLNGCLLCWSPERPTLSKLRVSLLHDTQLVDTVEMTYGHRTFALCEKRFVLNNRPITLRAGSVVWHRWCRDPEARELAFDVDWFEQNIVKRLKSHGANTLRFHLGMPPESFLDLCDRHGLMVQAEWSFFHAMEGGFQSLVEQWRSWLDLCLRHPSVCLFHPWNETAGDALKTAFSALDAITPDYPDLVVSHRDVLHLHKYWWSLFCNVGILYDSADEFDQAIMVDEFGGNYLDGEANPGAYPEVASAFQRFLGPDHGKDERLELHSLSNNRMAEYWRRIGAAGFSPFCALGAPEDGNHHFMGALRDGTPKRVWQDLTAAYAPRSCSLDVWDRNYVPSSCSTVPLHLFNETDQDAELVVEIAWRQGADTATTQRVTQVLTPFEHKVVPVEVTAPKTNGRYHLDAVLVSGSPGVTHPIVSSWPVQVLEPAADMTGVVVGLPAGEAELAALFAAHGVKVCDATDPCCDVVLTGRQSWDDGVEAVVPILEQAIDRGIPVIMLDIGPKEHESHEPHQVPKSLPTGAFSDHVLCKGITVRFKALAEPESCIHPIAEEKTLWRGLTKEATHLWNGLRGGLVASAWDLEPLGMSQEALLSLWQERGATPEAIKSNSCVAYELAGHYTFAKAQDEAIERALRDEVCFLVEDAPALAGDIDPNADIIQHDLGREYQALADKGAVELIPLVSAGHSLCRTPVILVRFPGNQGQLLLSQLLTAGRLAEGFGSSGAYGVRQDPAAQQMVLNMIQLVLQK